MRNLTKANYLLTLLIPLFLAGLNACAGKANSTSSELRLPSTSPARVVDDYLEALQSADYVKTYDFISAGYAGNLDKESYRINIEEGLVKKFDWSLIDYQIKGVRILGSQAFVIAELGVQFKLPDSTDQVKKKVEIQYMLAASDDQWKITADNCVSNCAAGLGTSETVEGPIRYKSLEFK